MWELWHSVINIDNVVPQLPQTVRVLRLIETFLQEKNLTGCGWNSLDFNRPIVQLDGMFLKCTGRQGRRVEKPKAQPTRIKSNPWNRGVKAVDTDHQKPLSKKAGPGRQTED